MPGEFLNMAYVIHSDEAIMAVGFIFVVHMFNTHLRPEAFPITTTIFNGKISEEEMKRDHRIEWERVTGFVETPPPEAPAKTEKPPPTPVNRSKMRKNRLPKRNKRYRRTNKRAMRVHQRKRNMNRKHLLWLFIFLAFVPVQSFAQGTLADVYPLEQDRDCWGCHRLPNLETNAGAVASQSLCLECHSHAACQRKVGDAMLSLQVKADEFAATRHGSKACLSCHYDVGQSPHESKDGVQCVSCHERHGEGVAHDPHIRVRCEACHRDSLAVSLDKEADEIVLAHVDKDGKPVYLAGHEMTDTSNDEFCARCHQADNAVGAPAAVLPAKSVLCILCHPTSWTMGPSWFWIPAIIFILGVLSTMLVWFGGAVAGERNSLHKKIALSAEAVWSTVFSRNFCALVKVLVYDVLFQRRILKESVRRWTIHTLIYWGFIVRFVLAIVTGIMFAVAPECPVSMALMNKNHPFTAFAYDFLGLMIVVGVLWAIGRRLIVKPEYSVAEGQDKIALALVGLLILIGFVVEGARIIVTQIPADVAVYSFIGYPVSKLLAMFSVNWQGIYSVLWYVHALLGVTFIAYLPFSKMKHILFTPLVLAVNRDLKE